jgi:hypothetical protein
MTLDKEKSRKVQAQLDKLLKEPLEDSPIVEKDPIQPCSDLPGSRGSDFNGLVHAQSRGEKVMSKTIRFHTFKGLWGSIRRLIPFLILPLLVGCSCRQSPQCVDIYYFHERDGFNAGMYLLKGTLYPSQTEISNGMVMDTQWVKSKEELCLPPSHIKEGWYVVHVPSGTGTTIVYGTGIKEGVIYIRPNLFMEIDLKDKVCIGGKSCKRGREVIQ